MPDEIVETKQQPEGDVPADATAEQESEVAESGPESEGAGDHQELPSAPSAAEAAPPAELSASAQRAAEAAGELPEPLKAHLEAQVAEGGITRMNAVRESAKLGEAIGFSIDAIHAFCRKLLHARQAGQ